MTLVEQVEATVKSKESEFKLQPGFEELRRFYEEMQRQGIATKKEYDLPPVDTIGRTIYKQQ